MNEGAQQLDDWTRHMRRGNFEAAWKVSDLVLSHLMISVDTMTAHLAGALGVPVWTLLPKHADWRWMNEREDSPWYPTMRLFRQDRQVIGPKVIDRVAAALETLPASHKPRDH